MVRPLSSSGVSDGAPSSQPAVQPRPPASLAYRVMAMLGPDFSMFLFFLCIFLGLAFVYGAHFHLWGEGSILIAGGVGGGLVLLRFLWSLRAFMERRPGEWQKFLVGSKQVLRDWGPLILLTIVFENLHAYTGLIRKIPIDDWLYAFDLRLFGVEPTVWAGRFAHPLVTDYMAFAYGLYFILPMILITFLSLRRRRADFREMATSVILHMCVGFLGFICFPAGPPRFYGPFLAGVFQPPVLPSFGLFALQQSAFDEANPVATHSSFPSMHCALAMLTLLYAWRFGDAVFPRYKKLYFWICLPLVVSLWVSTVYLRHHWVLDCVAGWILGIGCYLVTPWIRKRWPEAERIAHSD